MGPDIRPKLNQWGGLALNLLGFDIIIDVGISQRNLDISYH